VKSKFTRADLWEILQGGGIDRPQAAALANKMISALASAIEAGQVIELRGLGTFEPRERPPRLAHNPRNLAPVDVPARHSVFFRPCGALKAAMNRRGEADGDHGNPSKPPPWMKQAIRPSAPENYT
jgi:nucleoid DNA-binding protein